MSGKLILISALVGLIVAALVSAQTNIPNELNRVDPSKGPQNQNQNQQQRPQQQPQGNTDSDNDDEVVSPSSNENELRLPTNDPRNRQNNQNELVPKTENDEEQEDSVFPFDPLGIFDPRPRPVRPNRGGSFMSLFQDPMRHFERHRQMMNQKFSDLERQAAEGQSISYFTNGNGITYKKVCTVERVGQDQQQQSQQ